MEPTKGTEKCLVEKICCVELRSNTVRVPTVLLCVSECDVYVALTYMKDILLSGRFVKGDLRSVSNSFFTHYGAVDDSGRQLHSP